MMVLIVMCIIILSNAIHHLPPPHTHTGVSAVWLVVSLVCSVLALLSKEQGVTALPVCLAMDFLVLHKVPTNYRIAIDISAAPKFCE